VRGGAEEEGERESQPDSPLSIEPDDVGLHLGAQSQDP